MPALRPGLANGLFVLIAAAGIADAVLGGSAWQWLGMAATAVFLVLEVRRIPRFQNLMAAVLVAVGLAVGLAGGASAVDLVLTGLAKTQIFLVLFFAIMWLQAPATTSLALAAVRRTVVSQPPGRRFLYLAGSVHFLGAVLNIAGLVLLSGMVERQKDPVLQRRMAAALMQSFVLGSTWSPFYVSVVVVLVALPELRLADAITGGLPLGAVGIACAWGYDRIRYRRRRGAPGGPVPAAVPLAARYRWHLVCVFGILTTLVIGDVEVTGLPLPVVLGLVAPPFGIAWMAVIENPGVRPGRSAATLARGILERAAGLRSETLAFTASSIVGVGFAAGFPTEWLAGVLPGPGAVIFAPVFGVLALGVLGIHPRVPVIIVSEAIPPDVLGLPVKIVAMCLLSAWGLATLVSPVSGTSLMMARFVPVSSYTLAWRWNPPFVAIAASAVGLSVYAAWRMELY